MQKKDRCQTLNGDIFYLLGANVNKIKCLKKVKYLRELHVAIS